MLNDLIEISGGFQSSVNISYDLNNQNKIQSFIPTTSALELISNIILSTDPQSTQRAKILTGAYGRGKSHIILVALALLKRTTPKRIFDNLLKRMKLYDEDAYKITQNYIDSKTKLLPVIINGNGTSLTQTFINSLQLALSANGLDDIMPETNFDAAANTINRWKEDYPSAYKIFTKSISTKIKPFLSKLEEHDPQTYKEFVRIYPQLTAGGIFNPFENSNAEDVYESVSIALKEKGYNGLYVVYDEFGKYLESSISEATESDTLFLQNFAEKCNRSGEQQMHIMLICHKDISNYIDMNLSKDKVDGWRGISGRFEHINLHNNYSQMYEIISAVIEKKPGSWKDFCNNYDNAFTNLAKRFTDNKLLENETFQAKETVVSCYPLHPSTTFILPRLSEKVAQNERTLFTFLSANQKNTLVEYIEKCENEFTFITPDYLYDYFEPQLKKELNSSNIFKIYQLAANILKKVERGSLQSKIIKTIALTYIIEQFEKFPPTVNNIVNTFIDTVVDPKEITDSIKDLEENSCIVYLKRSNNYLKLKESSGVNIKDQIDDRIMQLKSKLSTKDILNELSDNNYLYPIRYNDIHCITRYFELKFVSLNELNAIGNVLPDTGESGSVRALFFNTKVEFDEFKKNEKNNIRNQNRQIITIVPKKFIDISSLAFEYKAVLELKAESSEDEVLADEYDVYLEDLDVVVSNYISSFTRPELDMVKYYYLNKELKISRKAQLSACLSDICEKLYPYSPIINNESINKNVLPTVAINSRNKVTTALLESSSIKENLGLTGTGQDVSIMRSTLIQTGILTKDGEKYQLNITPENDNIRNVLLTIKTFFLNANVNNGSSFGDLYNTLTSVDQGIGLKRGVIPIYIAVVLNYLKNDVIIRYNYEEIKLSSDLLNSINEEPQNYSVIIENWDADKTNYLGSLEKVFERFIVEKEKSYNSFVYIALAMTRWYMGLPRCAKDMKEYYDSGKKLPQEYIKLIELLKLPTENSRELLMVLIPKAYKEENVSIAIADSIEKAKKVFESAKERLVKKIISITKSVFGGKKEASLTSVMRDWYENLKESTIQKQFPNNENSILSMISTITNDEQMFIERLAKAVIGLRIDDWNSSNVDEYKTNLEKIKNMITDFDTSEQNNSNSINNKCKLVFSDDSGNEITRVIDKVECGKMAQLLYNDITSAIDEMGQAISEQEKRQVLIEVLKELCQ